MTTIAAVDTLRIEYVPLTSIERWPRNPKAHDDDTIEGSIARFGFVSPLVRDEASGKLVAGHGRLDALLTLKAQGGAPPERVKVKGKQWLIPVLCGVQFADEGEAEAYLLADNRTAEVGGWDTGALAAVIRDLAAGGTSLEHIGWSAKQIDGLLAEVKAPMPVKTSRYTDDDFKTSRGSEARVVSVYLDASEHPAVVARMRAIMDARKLPDYAALLRALLDHYEQTPPAGAPSADPFVE